MFNIPMFLWSYNRLSNCYCQLGTWKPWKKKKYDPKELSWTIISNIKQISMAKLTFIPSEIIRKFCDDFVKNRI